MAGPPRFAFRTVSSDSRAPSAQTWGLEVRRFIKRREEEDDWSFWHKNEAGGPPRFGHLEGLRIQSSSSHLELMPYASAKSSSLADDAGTPFDTHGRPTMRGGLDLRDNVTSNLTLNATINPDFGQVEVDPAVLNLSAFETFFPEKRPFFVENSQVFDFGLFNCNFCSNVEAMQGFYSRRVGRAPTGADLASENYPYADIPDATTILGAGKVTGRTASGFTVGLLDALTGQANARIVLPNGSRGSQEVEPLANYFVGRLKRDFLHGNLVVGGMLSGVARNIDTTFAPRLARNAEMYGNDVVYRWADNEFSLMANAAITNVSGDPTRDCASPAVERALLSASGSRRRARADSSPVTTTPRRRTCAASAATPASRKRLATGSGRVPSTRGRQATRPTTIAFQQYADYIWYNAQPHSLLVQADEVVPDDVWPPRRANAAELRGRPHSSPGSRVRELHDSPVLEPDGIPNR